jgi:hypothetical protein
LQINNAFIQAIINKAELPDYLQLAMKIPLT